MSMTGIALIVAAFVILLLVIGGGLIFFVVRKSKSKAAALPAPGELESFGVPPPTPQHQDWSGSPVEPAPAWSSPAPAEDALPEVFSEPPLPEVSEPPALAPEPPPPIPESAGFAPEVPAPLPADPFPPVQPGISNAPPVVAGDPLAATLGPESYTTTPNVSSIPMSTVDPFATAPNVPVGHAAHIVPAKLRAHDGSVIQLVRVQMRVGRHPDCEIVIPTPGTSRSHAEFQCVNGAWVVNDLNSGNGTFVNGVRVRTHQLSSGDEVRVDQTKFWFTLGS